MGAPPRAPRLDVVVGALNAAGARYVVIGGFAVIAHRKRLAGRPHDRRDLEALAEIHGELPFDPSPGLDG